MDLGYYLQNTHEIEEIALHDIHTGFIPKMPTR